MTKTADATFVALANCAPGDFPASICTKIAAHIKGVTSERTVMIACRWSVTGAGSKSRHISWRLGETGSAGFPVVPNRSVNTKVPTFPSS